VGTSLISKTVVNGIIVLVIIIVGVVFATSANAGVRSFIDSIKFWEDDVEQKEAVDLLLNAYKHCKNMEGDNCICDSGIDLKPFQEKFYVENLDDGIWFDSVGKGLPNLQTCIVFSSFIQEGDSFGDISFVQHSEIYYENDEIRYGLNEEIHDVILNSLEIYFNSIKRSLIPQDAMSLGQMLHLWKNYPDLNSLDSTVLETNPTKLFRHEEGDFVYLCLVSSGSFITSEGTDFERHFNFPLFKFKTCEELTSCNNVCGPEETCPKRMEREDYQGKGTCCKVPCIAFEEYEINAQFLYGEAMKSYESKSYDQAKIKFEKVYSEYGSSIYSDNALYYIALIIIENEKDEIQGLFKLRQLLREFSEFSNTEYGNFFSMALEKSNELLNCNAIIEDDCLVKRDSLLQGCYWQPDAWYSFMGPDGTCESCDEIGSCLSFYQVAGGKHLPDSCEKNSCQDVGKPKCKSPKQGMLEEAWYCKSDPLEKIKCEDLTSLNNPFFCNIQTCVLQDEGGGFYTLDDPINCCKWIGTECVSI